MMTLTDNERNKFANYCREQSQSEIAMANQLEKLGPGHANGVKMMRQRATAFAIVSNYLDSGETTEIKG